MTNHLNEPNLDAVLDTILDEQPMAPLPPNFMQQAMARIATIPQPEPFRLYWSDFILPLILTLVFAAGLFVGLDYAGIFEFAWLPEVNINVSADWSPSDSRMRNTILLVSAELIAIAIGYFTFLRKGFEK